MAKEQSQNQPDPGTMEFKLTTPVEIDGAQVALLRLRKPKVRDMRKMMANKGTEADRVVSMIADLAMITPNQVDEIDLPDFTRLVDEMNKAGYLGNSQAAATPGTPS